MSGDGRYALAQVANGDGGEFAYYLMDLSAGRTDTWTQVAQFSDKIVQAVFGKDQALYLLSRNNAPRGKVLRLPLGKFILANAKKGGPQSGPAIRPLSAAVTLLHRTGV